LCIFATLIERAPKSIANIPTPSLSLRFQFLYFLPLEGGRTKVGVECFPPVIPAVSYVIPAKLVLDLIGERESIFSVIASTAYGAWQSHSISSQNITIFKLYDGTFQKSFFL